MSNNELVEDLSTRASGKQIAGLSAAALLLSAGVAVVAKGGSETTVPDDTTVRDQMQSEQRFREAQERGEVIDEVSSNGPSPADIAPVQSAEQVVVAPK